MNKSLNEVLTDEANQIIQDTVVHIREQYPKVRETYQNHYDWPELDPLRHEISLCLTFGLFQAAIALTNHFLESLIKYTLIVFHSRDTIRKYKGNKVDAMGSGTSDARLKYGKANLGDNINALRKTGLISKEQKRQLDELRNSMRNAYSHADKEKTFQDGTIPVQPMELKNGKFEMEKKRDARIAELIITQGIAQAIQAKHEAPNYFLYVDSLAREIIEKLFGENHESAV